MLQRGRKSSDPVISQSTIAFAKNFLQPPATLPASQRATWDALVHSRTPDWFGPEHIPLLEQYCSTKQTADGLKREVEQYKGKPPRGTAALGRYRALLAEMNSASKILNTLGRSMRMTQSTSNNKGRSAVPDAARPMLFVEPWFRVRPQDPVLGAEVIAWIEQHCVIPEGALVGQGVRLTQKQKKWIKKIFDTPTRTFILSMARKNAKTALSAFLLLVYLCGPTSRANSQLYSTALSREQAAILFSYAAKCVRLSASLSAYVGIRDTAKQLYCQRRGTLYRALSADVSTSFGLSPAFVVHDELGQVRGPKSDLYEAIETAGAAQESPLSIIISTQAATDNDLLSILIDDALTGADPRVKVELYSAPLKKLREDGTEETLSPFTLPQVRAANPHFDDFMNKSEVARQMAEAQRLPSRESSFRNLILNQRVEAKARFISREVWMENGTKPQPLKGKRVFGALDLASVSDLCSLTLVSEEGDVVPTFWLPKEGLKEKSRVDRVPYDVWEQQGFLQTTPGRAVEYEFIAAALRGVFTDHEIVAFAYDRYNIKHLRPWLVKAGFTEKELERFVDFGQGFVSMSPALRELETRLLGKKLRHGNHPVLTMCMDNATVVKDPAGNRKFTKAKATGRIDGAVTLAMAVGVQPTDATPLKKFQMLFI